ncbi:MAG: TonB family protein [Acidobacteria bacterium]|nr:TonB family protein [Acidobacteriota bacterium]MBI3423535.1 TonB family protein [Acidobacteriota bacterium]
MTIRKTKIVVMTGFLLLLSSLLILSSSTNAQKRRTGGSAPRAAQPAAQFKTCPVCNGSGKTHEHVSKYEEVRCYNCAGRGIVQCTGKYSFPVGFPHNRSDSFNCELCKGTGWKNCSVCGGSGTRSEDKSYDVTNVCQTCKGNGRVQMTRVEIRAKAEAEEAIRREAAKAKAEAEEAIRREAAKAKAEAEEPIRRERKIKKLREQNLIIQVSSDVLQDSAIKKVQPQFPTIAKSARVQGLVQVQLLVSDEGDVLDASIISGHPLLRNAALEAARKWMFKPTKVDGVLVGVQGILSFNFTLQ